MYLYYQIYFIFHRMQPLELDGLLQLSAGCWLFLAIKKPPKGLSYMNGILLKVGTVKDLCRYLHTKLFRKLLPRVLLGLEEKRLCVGESRI